MVGWHPYENRLPSVGNRYQCNCRVQPNCYSILSTKDHRIQCLLLHSSQILQYLLQIEVSDYPMEGKIARDDLMLQCSDQSMFFLSTVQIILDFRHRRQPIDFRFENLL